VPPESRQWKVQPHHKYYYDVPQVGDFMGEGDCDSEGCIMTRVETSKSFYGLGTLRSNVRQCLFVSFLARQDKKTSQKCDMTLWVGAWPVCLSFGPPCPHFPYARPVANWQLTFAALKQSRRALSLSLSAFLLFFPSGAKSNVQAEALSLAPAHHSLCMRCSRESVLTA